MRLYEERERGGGEGGVQKETGKSKNINEDSNIIGGVAVSYQDPPPPPLQSTTRTIGRVGQALKRRDFGMEVRGSQPDIGRKSVRRHMCGRTVKVHCC